MCNSFSALLPTSVHVILGMYLFLPRILYMHICIVYHGTYCHARNTAISRRLCAPGIAHA